MSAPAFTYADLFAGIGGFHAVLDAMGGECVYAVEVDPAAQDVYEANWGMRPLGSNGKGDITLDTQIDGVVNVPEHDVLVAGFPCQPFSKSGAQKGMDEIRGTLFFDIMRIVRDRKPAVVLLENVRNLAGPRHTHEWDKIIEHLRVAGYRVSHKPAVLSPARIAPEHGGHPQTRDRVFIAATRVVPQHPVPEVAAQLLSGDLVLPNPVEDDDDAAMPISHFMDDIEMKRQWDLMKDLPLDEELQGGASVSAEEWKWIDHWDELIQRARALLAYEAHRDGRPTRDIPGFPIWANVWTASERERTQMFAEAAGMAWKVGHLKKNFDLYDRLCAYDRTTSESTWTAMWLHKTAQFPESRQKLEWQAQDASSVRDCVISMRPSGLRVKRMTHLPALVAISQTPIIGPLKRRLTISEGTLLQGLPASFKGATWKQLGNGVNTGVVAQALLAQVERDAWLLELDLRGSRVLGAVRSTMRDTAGDLRDRIARSVERGQARTAVVADGFRAA